MSVRGPTKRAGSSTVRRAVRAEDNNNNGGGFVSIHGNAAAAAVAAAAAGVASGVAVDCTAANAAIDEATAAALSAAAGVAYPYVDMSMYEDYLRPIYKDGDVLLEVECGDNQGLLYLSRLCQGSKGPCIFFNGMWLTPNEFQYISGRETAKDWKRSIRHHGKSMKLLLSKGILAVHPPICDCDGCRISSPVSASKVKCAGQNKPTPPIVPAQSPLPTPAGPFATASAVYPAAENRGGRTGENNKRLTSSTAQLNPLDISVNRRGSNGRNKKNLLGLPASGYSDHVHELQVLIAQTQRKAEQLQKNMDSMKNKNEPINKSPEPTEKKRESRLTSIIDLLSNKAKGLKEEAAKCNSTATITTTNNVNNNNNGDGSTPVTTPVCVDIPTRHEEPITSDDNSSEDRREVSSTSSATSSTSGDSVSSSVSLDSGQSEISTGSSLDGNGSTNCASSDHFGRLNNANATPKAEGARLSNIESGTRFASHDNNDMSGQRGDKNNKTSNGSSRKKNARTSKDGNAHAQNGFAPPEASVATSSAFVTHGGRSDACADSLPLAQLRAFAAAAAAEPKVLTNNNNNNLSGGGLLLGVGTMPGDTLYVDASKIKTERLTPDLLDSSNSPLASPRSSPRSTSSRIHPHHHHHHHHLLVPTPPLGLEHLSPAALLGGGCGTPPVLKQMEQMVSRNYSDIMRSLAARYNNSNNNNDRYNGLERKFDGRFPTPPLLGLSKSDVEGVRKNENHSAPPVLGEQRSPVSGSGFGGGLVPSMMDMSSTQALLSMVRSASAHNASQLETYLRGATKRPAGDNENLRSDPLDLTTSSGKKARIAMDKFAATYTACLDAAALNMRLPGGDQPATSIAANKPLRDFRELLGKREEHNQADPAPGTPGTSPKPGEAKTPRAESPQPKNKSSSSSPATAFNSLPCLSNCVDRACTPESQADQVAHWTVDDVCKFVASIDTCSEYVQTFREQSIDGAALPMLTEEHLINNMNMKLGPVLKLRSTLAKKIGHCAVCMHCIHCHGATVENRRPEST